MAQQLRVERLAHQLRVVRQRVEQLLLAQEAAVRQPLKQLQLAAAAEAPAPAAEGAAQRVDQRRVLLEAAAAEEASAPTAASLWNAQRNQSFRMYSNTGGGLTDHGGRST